jgi:L-fuculose-phosphate aldolase
MNREALRAEIIATAVRMNGCGINRGKSGNVSARTDTGFLITPTGLPYESLLPRDIVAMTDAGAASGARSPSSEWRFHRDIYASRADAGAIVHAHSSFATSLACLGRDIPAFHYMVAVAGGKDIRCAAYATFGTQALSDNALLALSGRRACLLANHGMIAVAETLEAALAVAVEVEALAEQYWRALQIGAPNILSDEEMSLVLDKFKGYGQAP